MSSLHERELIGTPVSQLDAAALELHRDCVVVDAHVDTVLKLVEGGASLSGGVPDGHVDRERARAGGVDVLFFAHYVSGQYKPALALVRCVQLLDAALAQVDGEQIVLVSDAAGAREAARHGQLGLYLTIEGGEVLHERLEVLRVLHRLGIRSLGLTWNERNQLAEGIGDMDSGGGLSATGRAVVSELERLGVILDVAHLSPAGFWDAVRRAQRPVIASHANAAQLWPHPRNLADEQVRALAATGGVVGVTFAPAFLSERGATLSHVLDHIEHLAALVGPEHVAVGSDFDGIGSTPLGLEDVGAMPRLTAGMLGRGFPSTSIRAILGENLLRIMG